VNVDLSTDAPPSPGRTLELAAVAAQIVRALNRATMHHEALKFPAEADRLLRELERMTSMLPQLLAQIARWAAVEDAAGRIEAPSGEWACIPGTAVTALQVRLDAARASAETLRADLENAAQVTSTMAAREDDSDD
jgi:hypothetical protein